MNPTHLRELVIRPTLQHLQLGGAAAEDLLLGTAAQESGLGASLKQLGKGPALGIYQTEPATHDDIWANFLRYRGDLRDRVIALLAHVNLGLPLPVTSQDSLAHQLVWNVAYATAIARLVYLRDPAPLPAAGDVVAMAATWKRVYNTEGGAGTVDEFKRNWGRLCG